MGPAGLVAYEQKATENSATENSVTWTLVQTRMKGNSVSTNEIRARLSVMGNIPVVGLIERRKTGGDLERTLNHSPCA
jgi:hypothetical protein